MPAKEVEKRIAFFILWIKNRTAKIKISRAMAISTQRTKRDTPKLDHLEEAKRIMLGR